MRANTSIVATVAQVHGQRPADADVAVVCNCSRCVRSIVNTVDFLRSACCGNDHIVAVERDRTALRINAVHRTVLCYIIFLDCHSQRCGDCDALFCGNAIDITTTLRSHSQLAGAGDVQLAAVGPYAVQITGSCRACGKAAVTLNLNVQVAVRKNHVMCRNAVVVLEVQRTAGLVIACNIGLRAVIAVACVGSIICGKVLLVAEAGSIAACVEHPDVIRIGDCGRGGVVHRELLARIPCAIQLFGDIVIACRKVIEVYRTTVLIRAAQGGRRWIDRLVFSRVVHFRLLHQCERLISVTQRYLRCEGECSLGAGRADGRKGRRSDKGIVLRRHGDILVGNGEGVARRGSRFVEHHIRKSPLFEWNFLPTPTFLGGGRDVHLVTRKEISAAICMLDAGAGERAVHDHHLIGRAVAVRGVAVGLIHIDCMVCVAEGRSSGEGTAGVEGIVGLFFPLDLHIANLGQGRSSHRINTVAVSIILILTGVCHVDLNRAVGVDAHISFCEHSIAVITACRIVRRSTGDIHRSVFGDGDVLLRENAVCVIVAFCAIVRHIDGHFGIALDRHIAGLIAAR